MLRWLKRFVFVLMALLVVCAAYVATVYFFGSEDARGRLGLVYAAIVANHHPPPIAASGVLSNGPDWMLPEPASTKFTAVLRRDFPQGSGERAMLESLGAQGFKLEEITDCQYVNGAMHPGGSRCETRDLEYEWGGVPCNNRLVVRWSADRKDRLVNISGFYGVGCL
jgi:hypothetical protein